jgi:2-polyprenyl-3-methyl-5-hydroxy-6-metoxy-1,4-benzoquinol methylase
VSTSAYDAIAEWYDQWLGVSAASVGPDPYFIDVEPLLGDIAGQHICDLACGQGRVARHLADRGAAVVGIDISARLLEIARQHDARRPRGVRYLRADARQLDCIRSGVFDTVLCFMALMDIEELGPTVRHAARMLRPGGQFICAMLHPCYNTPQSGEWVAPDRVVRTIASYFVEGFWTSSTRTGPPGRVGAYHRTLSTYLNTLTDAGLILERVYEPQAAGITAQRRPIWTEVPAVLTMRWRKPGSTSSSLDASRS